MNYLATFYTQAAALLSQRALKQAGLVSKAGPEPQLDDSSRGTGPNLVLLDHDLESLYEVTDGSYRQIIHRD